MSNALKPETEEIQNALATYCRTGVIPEVIPARKERLHHYRRLVYNVIWDTLKTAYPLTFKALERQEWDVLINDFFINHPASDPQVWKMPKELWEYVAQANYSAKLEKPYLAELLEFEWLEIELYSKENTAIKPYSTIGDTLHSIPVLNPYLVTREYHFPVYKFIGEELLDKKGPFHILIFRSEKDYKVHFIELNPFTYLLILVIQENEGLSLEAHLAEACKLMNIDFNQAIVEQSVTFFNMLLSKNVILGFTE